MPAKQLKMSFLQVFSEMTTQRNGFGQTSCAAYQPACVFGSCECNKHSVLKIFMIKGGFPVMAKTTRELAASTP